MRISLRDCSVGILKKLPRSVAICVKPTDISAASSVVAPIARVMATNVELPACNSKKLRLACSAKARNSLLRDSVAGPNEFSRSEAVSLASAPNCTALVPANASPAPAAVTPATAIPNAALPSFCRLPVAPRIAPRVRSVASMIISTFSAIMLLDYLPLSVNYRQSPHPVHRRAVRNLPRRHAPALCHL